MIVASTRHSTRWALAVTLQEIQRFRGIEIFIQVSRFGTGDIALNRATRLTARAIRRSASCLVTVGRGGSRRALTIIVVLDSLVSLRIFFGKHGFFWGLSNTMCKELLNSIVTYYIDNQFFACDKLFLK